MVIEFLVNIKIVINAAVSLSQNWNNDSRSVHTHAGLELLQLFDALIHWWITVQTHGPRAPCQCKHNVDVIQTYKYINIYKTCICLQCFATVMHLHCIFWSSSRVCAVYHFTRLFQISLHFFQKTMSQILHPCIFEVLTNWISFLHLETLLRTEAHNSKGFPGGCRQLKRILFIELEWKKCTKCYLTGTLEPAPKNRQLKASTAPPLGVN